ncbi:hypothetical protein MIMGU_mgv1a020803mg [Erythranthe guttata]|uniref:Uncharacterized protein n=1 Tax=Erythranthe guttata TaxID=4155 RepID=A0A022QN71_ERYGU|nr:PREDICTED: uncharacterized protein LOC105967302 [Erythranthe guttata]EYU29029.1 hypothetical protein MIMGU_mgv1a020803mg [Erythranthe guttata]|eukprot:XP_012847356.1 PREDICTED: uncharacterized protein LOC105967302 [Erythranthe guttata]
MTGYDEPIIYRLNRLDNSMKQLQDIMSFGGGDHYSPKSSYASTTSSGTLTSEARPSFSPESLEKRCRPVDEVLMEVEQKGTLIQRLVHAEDLIFKMCMQLEEEFEAESKELKEISEKKSPSPSKKGLKQLVKSCVGGKTKHSNKIKA